MGAMRATTKTAMLTMALASVLALAGCSLSAGSGGSSAGGSTSGSTGATSAPADTSAPIEAPTTPVTVTPDPVATSDTVAQACSQVTTALADVMADPESLLTKAVSGDTSAFEPLVAFATELGNAAAVVTEPTVKAALERVQTAYTTIADVITQLEGADFNDPATLAKAQQLVKENFAVLQDATASMTDLKALCPGL